MNQAPCLVEADVDAYGFLFGGVESAPPGGMVYEFGDEEIDVEWERGDAGSLPNVFRHNLIRDFVVDEVALRVLRAVAGDDLTVNVTLRLDGRVLFAVQAKPVLDVVDEARSIPSDYSWAKIGYPHIDAERWDSLCGRVFHLPYPELATTVVVGAKVRDAYGQAGLTGWRFEPATVDE